MIYIDIVLLTICVMFGFRINKLEKELAEQKRKKLKKKAKANKKIINFEKMKRLKGDLPISSDK